MDEITKSRIDDVREEIVRSDLEPEVKDALKLRLDHAYKCSNGTQDKIPLIAAAVGDMILSEVKSEVRRDDRVRSVVSETVAVAIKEHLKDCPLRKAGEAAATAQPAEQSQFLGKLGAAGRVYERLTIEARVGVIFAILWAVKTFGVETVLGWVKGLLA